MITVGSLIKEGRNAKGLNRKELEDLTHIKSSFIAAIENAEWDKLPDFSTALGFIKSISHFLEIDDNQTVSIFRRDYPSVLKNRTEQKRTKEIERKFFWGPRITFAAGVIIILAMVLGYLGFQYRKFNLPPSLVVSSPTEEQVVSQGNLAVTGKTDADATVIINNQPVVVADDGNFNANIDISKNTNEIEILARSRSGKQTVVHRKINFKQ